MRALRVIGLLLLLVVVALGSWGLIEGRFVSEEHEVGVVPELPESFEGRRVAVLGDLQIGMWLDNDDVAERMVETIVNERPAAVLLVGDFVYRTGDPAKADEEVRRVQALLRPLTRARIPTYAVLGNHDYSQPSPGDPVDTELADKVAAGLQQVGIEVLRNGSARLPGADTLYVVGIGPENPGVADVARAFSGVPDGAARIVMMHNPDTFPDIPEGAAPLAVAGHTHGGQIAIPGTPEWSWLGMVWSGEAATDGWISDYGAPGNRLYVTRGVGFSVVPMRIGAPPELTWFTLMKPGTLANR